MQMLIMLVIGFSLAKCGVPLWQSVIIILVLSEVLSGACPKARDRGRVTDEEIDNFDDPFSDLS